jgi:multiple sugar transport system substrate-binding protein
MNHSMLSRRNFLRLSSVTAGAAFLAACASSGTPAPAPTAGEGAGESPAAAAQEVRYASWDWFAYVPGQTWAEYHEAEAFPQFESEFPDIELVWEPHGDAWEEKALTQMAAGTAPDVMSTWPPILNAWAEKQQLLDLQPLVEVDLPDAEELFLADSWAQMWDPITQIRMGMCTDIDVTSVYYNKQAFEEAGVAMPTSTWTVEEYTAAAEKLTVRDGNNVTRWGAQLRPDFILGYAYYVQAFGGNLRDDDTMLTCLLGEEKAQQALEWIRTGMWDLNCFAQTTQIESTGIPSTWTGVLPANVVACAERSADQFFSLAESMPAGSWDIAHVPMGPAGAACMGAPDAWVVYKGVVERGNQQSAWEFVKWMASSEYYQNNIATKAGRIPTLRSAAAKWPDTLRSLDERLSGISLEVILEQLDSGEARGPQLFRFQTVADEILNPAIEQIFVEGSAPVSILDEIAQQVTKAQQDALQRAGGA